MDIDRPASQSPEIPTDSVWDNLQNDRPNVDLSLNPIIFPMGHRIIRTDATTAPVPGSMKQTFKFTKGGRGKFVDIVSPKTPSPPPPPGVGRGKFVAPDGDTTVSPKFLSTPAPGVGRGIFATVIGQPSGIGRGKLCTVTDNNNENVLRSNEEEKKSPPNNNPSVKLPTPYSPSLGCESLKLDDLSSLPSFQNLNISTVSRLLFPPIQQSCCSNDENEVVIVDVVVDPPEKYRDDDKSTDDNSNVLKQLSSDVLNSSLSNEENKEFFDSFYGLVKIIEVKNDKTSPTTKPPKRFSTNRYSTTNGSFNNNNNANDSDSGSSSLDESITKLHDANHQKLITNWPKGKFVDTHCHLDLICNRFNFEDFDVLKYKCKDSWSPNFAGCITDFCFPESYVVDKTNFWDNMLSSEFVWAAIGCHPHQANAYTDDVESFIKTKVSQFPAKVVAIGELGLDYSANNKVDKEIQKKVLERQLDLAQQLNLPLLLHCRDAVDDCLEIFKNKVRHDYPIHWHSFMSTLDVAQKWSDYFTKLNFGVTTAVYNVRNNGEQENFYKNCPTHRLLIETDAPYFLPHHYRTKKYGRLEFNHPGIGALVAVKLAEIRNEEVVNVFEEVFRNTTSLYKLNF